MNARDEEWQEDRLRAAIAAHSEGVPVERMLDELLACADAHAAGAPQHDDMTLVGLRARVAAN